jgi:CBS domain containing-hemolysin-like protein
VGDKPISEIIRKIDYVQEDMEAQELLALLIKNKRSIAVVNDEYGGTAGIVTLEDLIEEIFGEISDELDKEELPEKKISDNEYIFSGRLEIKYLNKTYDLDIPESDFYETLGGFITWFHENIPAEGELLKYDNFEFSILKTGSNRVESVVLRIVEE